MRLIAAFVFAVISALTLTSPATAGLPTDTMKTTTDKVVAVLQDTSLKSPAREAERRKKIRAAVYDVFDFGEMAKRSLATAWRDRTPQEKKEFTDLFANLLERSYINRIESYSGEKISYDTESVDGEYAVVKSRFFNKRKEEINVDYKLLKEDAGWMVYDVVVEGVSLVNNYRVQFSKIIRSSSYDGLVKKLKDKALGEELAAPASNGKK